MTYQAPDKNFAKSELADQTPLSVIPDDPKWDLLRWTLAVVSTTFPTVFASFTANEVIEWMGSVDDGDRTLDQLREDIFRFRVTEQAIMDTYFVTSEEAEKLITGEMAFSSLPDVEPWSGVSEAGHNLNSVPGKPQVWLIDGQAHLVYTIPDSEPPIYLSWLVPDKDELQSMFGPDVEIVYDKEITQDKATNWGVINFGSTAELANFDDDPFLTWADTLAIQAQSQPWILDPDYQALIAMAMLEGRPLSEAEIQSTEWWQNHTEAEREWMKLYHGDPESADQMVEDNRIRTITALQAAGVENPSEAMVNYMADAVTMGTWSVTYYQQQITAVADPWSGFTVDAEIVPLMGGAGVTHEGELDIESQVKSWLGPVHGEWDQSLYEEWAGKIRNDPDQELALIDYLKKQRLALFPEYENENLTYNDIAAPWKSYVASVWGQQADETDPMFATLLKNNDSALNGQLLRQEGFDRGIGKVVDDAQTQLISSAGGTLRRAIV